MPKNKSSEHDTALSVSKSGWDLINDPQLNKGTAFSLRERDDFGLHGLLPPKCATMETQVYRIMENYYRKSDPLDKFIFLTSLQDRNETLFYRILLDHLESMTPIIYTPTVGLACQQFGHIFRQSRGMYFSSEDRGKIRTIMDNWPQDDVDIIVVTDGSRILGLGDLGANGMGIPIGKLSLYIACGGIYPSRTLPVMMDVGTNNIDFLNDSLYLGINQTRLRGEAYYDLMDEFMQAVNDRWPGILVQFEDFSNDHAFALLDRYREDYLCFNDDIQGTGSVALAGLISALRETGGNLGDQKIVFFGAGAAAIGIANMVAAGIMEEGGISMDKARRCFWFLDSNGLVSTKRGDQLVEHKLPYARNEVWLPDLLAVVKKVKPTVLMGLSGQPQSFNEEVLSEMARHVERPIIFALSNPTSKAECSAEQAYNWTEGRAIFASGSPFDPVEYKGKVYIPGQGNNMYIFPGIGLGASLCGAKKITDSMFYVAAKTLASRITREKLAQGNVFPELNRIRQITESIASAVIRLAYDQGLATEPKSDDILKFIQSKMYHPVYKDYVKA